MSKAIQLKDENNENVYSHPYYPIGSIYLSINNTNPSIFFGGKWEQISKGRTLVGVDESDSDFNTPQKIGGSKFLQNHTHSINTTPRDLPVTWQHGVQRFTYDYAPISNPNTYQADVGVAGSGNSGNLQPYFTCYIWCRTA